MSQELVGELSKEIDHCQVWARRNYNYAHLVFGITVMASFIAAILIGSNAKDWPEVGLGETGFRILLTALTAMPAALLLINNTLRFEERSKWFWRKCRKAQRLLRKMRDSRNPDPEVLSDEFSKISEEMENEWPAFGSSPSQPKKTGLD
ncbi:hypothetical protein [Pseudomonas sp. NPDC087626]|uniref:hypothetical protein n=1 Tax=Pseudomonas sp. NPDC087626 TaxID=3364444 RepID=UPI003820A2E4